MIKNIVSILNKGELEMQEDSIENALYIIISYVSCIKTKETKEQLEMDSTFSFSLPNNSINNEMNLKFRNSDLRTRQTKLI